MTSKQELIDEITSLENRRDALGFDEQDQTRFEVMSDKIHVLLLKLKKCCGADEFNQVVMTL